MDVFTDDKNINMIKIACNRMLKDKYNVSLSDEKVIDLLYKVINLIINDKKTHSLSINELNNLTLSKIRTIYEKYLLNNRESEKRSNILPEQLSTNTVSKDIPKDILEAKNNIASSKNNLEEHQNNVFLDEDMINYKLQELEKTRQVLPNFKTFDVPDDIVNEDVSQPIDYKNISFNMPSLKNITQQYKYFYINSSSRNWVINTHRNSIDIAISATLENNLLFPDKLCLPSFIANITPCVVMNIDDGHNTISYLFTCVNRNKIWDTWTTIDFPENINLTHRNWSIKLYDSNEQLLDMGNDGINILEIEKNNNGYIIKVDASLSYQFKVGQKIGIQTNKIRIIYENILHIQENVLYISSNNNTNIEEFINAVIMNNNSQFCFIVKYYMKL